MCQVIYIFFGSSLGKVWLCQVFIIVGYVTNFRGGGLFIHPPPPTAHPFREQHWKGPSWIGLKKRLCYRCFHVNFAEFLRTTFYRTPPGDCFWLKSKGTLTRNGLFRSSQKQHKVFSLEEKLGLKLLATLHTYGCSSHNSVPAIMIKSIIGKN